MRPILILASAFIATSFGLPSARAAAGGKDRTEGLIAAFKKVKTEGGKLVKQEKAANDRAFAELDDYFDFTTLTSKPIEPLADKLTPEEATRFKAKFRELIRLIAYANAGTAFRKAKLTLEPEVKKAARVAVPVKLRLEEDDLDLTVEFHWETVKGAWRIVDVLFDGDSLLKDYQNQIGKIVTKSGVPGLFKSLDNRRAELEKGQ
jgi:ABC-type transporter MlaC component